LTQATALIVLKKQEAENGVDYSARHGALCPACREKAKIYSTKPWEGSTRTRYHHCINVACYLCAMKVTIKSIEVDPVEVGR